MCITFFRINSSVQDGPYRLILIANRDEFYDRESKALDYWSDHPDVLGGLDLSLKTQNGTWLAASKKGKLGVLLNIQERKTPPIKLESRGTLVSNYVKEDLRAQDYIQNVLSGTKVYDGYHLLLFALTAERVNVHVLTNLEFGKRIEVRELIAGDHGLSNSPVVTPYKKVSYGEERFSELVTRYNAVEQKEALVSELKELLESKVRNYPDDVLFESKKDFMQPSQIEKLSSVFVSIPECNYGTRTHTIILVDWNNMMDYREYTMVDTNDESNTTPRWDYRKYEVQLDVKNE